MSKLKKKLAKLQANKKRKGKGKHTKKVKVSAEVLRMRILKQRCKVRPRRVYVFKKDGTVEMDMPLLSRRKDKNQRVSWFNIGGQYEIAANLLLTVTDPKMALALSGSFHAQVLNKSMRNKEGKMKGKAFVIKQTAIDRWIVSKEQDMKYMRSGRKALRLSHEA